MPFAPRPGLRVRHVVGLLAVVLCYAGLIQQTAASWLA